MLMTSLRLQTADWHRRAERAVNFRARMSDRTRYMDFLRRLFGFYDPLETLLGEFLASEISLQFEARRKSGLLALDLRHLGDSVTDVTRILRCTGLPVIASRATAFGALYVLEGATLGGQILSRHLATHLGIDVSNGGAFLSSYGSAVRAMWSSFGEVIERCCDTAAKQEEALEAAVQTFASFASWFEHDRRVPSDCVSSQSLARKDVRSEDVA